VEARDLVPVSRVALLVPGPVAYDLIISGGVNVYPAEVERVLGEVVGGVEDAALREHAHLAPARRPRDHHHRDALPRTPTGKVRRLELADLVTRTG